MNNVEMARAYIEEAERRIRIAEMMLREKAYAYSIRQCQEAVELLLKASLKLMGIEPPKWYNVGPILMEFSERFPDWFREKIPELAAISRWLRREREPSMYGDEELGGCPCFIARASPSATSCCSVVHWGLHRRAPQSPPYGGAVIGTSLVASISFNKQRLINTTFPK